VIYTAKY